MKKIIILGFPHTGTSILKSIFGHIETVHEVVDEKIFPSPEDWREALDKNKEFILCKYPYWSNLFLESKYDDCYKIFVIRDPRWVYSSLNKRFNVKEFGDENYKKMNEQVPLFKYSDTARLFNWFRISHPYPGYTMIRYEDFFDNNFENIKVILRNLGIDFEDHIFSNSRYKNYSVSGVDIPSEMPSPTNHAEYRTWQINQDIVNNNFPDKISLFQQQIEHFQNCQHIKCVYPSLEVKKNQLIECL